MEGARDLRLAQLGAAPAPHARLPPPPPAAGGACLVGGVAGGLEGQGGVVVEGEGTPTAHCRRPVAAAAAVATAPDCCGALLPVLPVPAAVPTALGAGAADDGALLCALPTPPLLLPTLPFRLFSLLENHLTTFSRVTALPPSSPSSSAAACLSMRVPAHAHSVQAQAQAQASTRAYRHRRMRTHDSLTRFDASACHSACACKKCDNDT